MVFALALHSFISRSVKKAWSSSEKVRDILIFLLSPPFPSDGWPNPAVRGLPKDTNRYHAPWCGLRKWPVRAGELPHLHRIDTNSGVCEWQSNDADHGVGGCKDHRDHRHGDADQPHKPSSH